jgi:hypothetical protein
MNPRFLPVLLAGLLAGTNGARAQTGKLPFLAPIVFFPPTPPVFGAAIPDQPPGRLPFYRGIELLPPDGMADFVGEYFYPALATRLFVPELNPKLEARLHTYRSKRLQQVTSLLNQFVGLHDAPPETCERELRTFAATQTPQLVALEIEAEQLREELIADGWRNGIDWNANRRWKLDVRKEHMDWAEAEAQFQVVRATAYYQKGLIPVQRGLVCELAIELQNAARKARGQPGARGDSDAIFFSPEMARFRLPFGASPGLREKIGLFNRRKVALKNELHDTIIALDREGAAQRAQAFEALADRQWPALVELEQLADEIRVELAVRLAPVAPPAPPWIPAGLIEMIHRYNEDRDTYFGELKVAMDTAIGLVPRPANDTPDAEREQAEFRSRQEQARRQAVADFQRVHAARFAQLELRYKTIRQTLAVAAEKQTDRKTGLPLNADNLLRAHAASMEEFNTFGRESAIYTHYRIAMLQPGLSPEQRRLLFTFAVAGLAQPLPYGEPMPVREAKRPYPAP